MDEQKLTRADKKLLEFAAQSGQLGKERLTVAEIARATGRKRDFIYKRLADKDFRQLFLDTLRTSLAIETPAILQRFVEEAKNGSYQHGKLILEITGMYKEEKHLDVSATVTAEQPFKDEAEKERFVVKTLDKYLPEEAGVAGDS